MVAIPDRAVLFAAVRNAPFSGSLTQHQVDGMHALLYAYPPALGTASLAYCLATTKHETGHAMSPVSEKLNYTMAARICQVWPRRFPSIAAAEPYVRDP